MARARVPACGTDQTVHRALGNRFLGIGRSVHVGIPPAGHVLLVAASAMTPWEHLAIDLIAYALDPIGRGRIAGSLSVA